MNQDEPVRNKVPKPGAAERVARRAVRRQRCRVGGDDAPGTGGL